MVAVPTATPFTSPVVAPMVAIDGVLLDHDPPGTASVSVVVVPWHMPNVPTMVPALQIAVIITLPLSELSAPRV